jgi:cytochrome b561
MSQIADDLQDTKNSYGWLSIILHWLTATWVISLWFLGNSSQSMDSGSYSTWSQWHVSIGVSGIVLILIRIWWRIRSGHPRIEGQADFVHLSAKIAHYILIAAIALMIISGPMILWSNGAPIVLYGKLIIHSPFSSALGIATEIRALHFWTSTAIIIISTVHIIGAFKHMMFNHDETFIRILLPRRPDKGPD